MSRSAIRPRGFPCRPARARRPRGPTPPVPRKYGEVPRACRREATRQRGNASGGTARGIGRECPDPIRRAGTRAAHDPPAAVPETARADACTLRLQPRTLPRPPPPPPAPAAAGPPAAPRPRPGAALEPAPAAEGAHALGPEPALDGPHEPVQ